MGPSTGMSGPAVAEPPLAHFQAQLHPNDSSLFDDQGYFLDNDFVCDIHRQLSIFGWKKSFRFGLYQQAILERLQELGFFVALPVGFNLRLHTPPGYIRYRLIDIFANARRAAEQHLRNERRSQIPVIMVQLTEVEDEHFQSGQAGPIEDDADFTDTDSEISADSDYDPRDESFTERLYALKDIVPPTTRGWISNKVDLGVSAVQNTWYYGSRTVWVVCATALMIGVPLATCWAEDQQIEGMEREYRMREMGGDALLAAGEGKEGSTADQIGLALDRAEAKPAL
ncbi:mitochondrial import receptor subunit tom22 [Colletotrichum incanum]|uniref:Mitochondrial import receptor subunit tom22 n=1 Tax=Colletotrichum incanum TaxID=1573173 RepID=A0A167BZK7_COLIC|nr:mitochondrial import receptor subunit tom22 [Colletotrichum incanum]OHW90074.1 mitochondrial import receptor subunit tom-22 [Colletotrichum incanum]